MVSTFLDELRGGLDGLDWSRQERDASARGRAPLHHDQAPAVEASAEPPEKTSLASTTPTATPPESAQLDMIRRLSSPTPTAPFPAAPLRHRPMPEGPHRRPWRGRRSEAASPAMDGRGDCASIAGRGGCGGGGGALGEALELRGDRAGVSLTWGFPFFQRR